MSQKSAAARRAAQLPAAQPPDDPEYGVQLRGDCLAPDIPDGERVLISTRLKPEPGDFVCIYLRPELVKPGALQGRIKRLVIAPPTDLTFPYDEHPDSTAQVVVICEQLNPHRRYVIPCSHVLEMHKVIWPTPEGVRFHWAGESQGRAA